MAAIGTVRDAYPHFNSLSYAALIKGSFEGTTIADFTDLLGNVIVPLMVVMY